MPVRPRWRRVRNDTLATAMDRYLHAYSVAFSIRRNGNDERLQLRVAHEQAPTANLSLRCGRRAWYAGGLRDEQTRNGLGKD